MTAPEATGRQGPVRLIVAVRWSGVPHRSQEWDVLSCGHVLAATGGPEDRRPCSPCSTPSTAGGAS